MGNWFTCAVSTSIEVHFVGQCGQDLLFDHLVGDGQQSIRDFDPKRLRGFQIDKELEFGRPLDRDIRRFFTS
jgi:hypothetical protein